MHNGGHCSVLTDLFPHGKMLIFVKQLRAVKEANIIDTLGQVEQNTAGKAGLLDLYTMGPVF